MYWRNIWFSSLASDLRRPRRYAAVCLRRQIVLPLRHQTSKWRRHRFGRQVWRDSPTIIRQSAKLLNASLISRIWVFSCSIRTNWSLSIVLHPARSPRSRWRSSSGRSSSWTFGRSASSRCASTRSPSFRLPGAIAPPIRQSPKRCATISKATNTNIINTNDPLAAQVRCDQSMYHWMKKSRSKSKTWNDVKGY